MGNGVQKGQNSVRFCLTVWGMACMNKEKYLLFLLRITTKTTKWKKFKRVGILTATSSFQVEWSNRGSYRKTAHFSFKWAKPTLLYSFYTILPIFYFTMLPIAQFSAAKVWFWIIIIKKSVCVCVWGGGGGGWIVIYNPTKNPIKMEENRCSSNAYTFYKNNHKKA